MSRVRVDLVCCGAGHQADPLSTGRRRKHGDDREGLASTWLVDPFSSGILFPDWKELQDKAWMWPIRETYDPLVVFRPRTWLLSEGWKLAGEISARDVPSKPR